MRMTVMGEVTNDINPKRLIYQTAHGRMSGNDGAKC